jgi:hypothetical protein
MAAVPARLVPRVCGGVVNHQDPPYPRGQSVESAFGGYGLYYRSPLAELGIVARAGTLLGDTPITVDVLYDTDRARRLASTFRDAVAATEYAKSWMLTTDPIPLDVLVEYARIACLCQLRERPAERAAVHDALFGEDPDTPPAPASAAQSGGDAAEADEDDAAALAAVAPGAAVTQRRRSVAHYLTLIDAEPRVVDDEGAYRQALWSPPSYRSADHERVAGQWPGWSPRTSGRTRCAASGPSSAALGSIGHWPGRARASRGTECGRSPVPWLAAPRP